MTNISVNLVSTFGPTVRGVSPYSDSLLASLRELDNLRIEPVDYIKQYPNLLLPSKGKDDTNSKNGYELIHYAKPETWDSFVGNSNEIVHIQYWSPFMATYLYFIAKRIKFAKKHLIVTVHNADQHEKIPLLKMIEKKFLGLCDAIICHNHTSATILAERFDAFNPLIKVIHHGVKQSKYDNSKDKRMMYCASLGLDPEKRYILFFGNIRPYKGIDLLLEAWSDIKYKHPNTCLIIAGRLWDGSRGILSVIAAKILGTAKHSLRIKRMAEMNSDSEQLKYLLSFVEQDDLEKLISISCLTVFPYTKFSGQSGAATLAAGIGTPVLVSNCGSLPDLAVDDRFIFSEISRKRIAVQLDEVLQNYANFTELRKHQVAKIKPYSWLHSAVAHRDLYREVFRG
ncbi:MAG: glycosyltransferase [Methylococcales bacterium]